jgi:hypothetical protein
MYMTTQKPTSTLDKEMISVNDGFEINYLQQRLGVSRNDVLKAIAKVGNGRREVVAYLEKYKRLAN